VWAHATAVSGHRVGLSALHHGSSDGISTCVAVWAHHPTGLSSGHADRRATQCLAMAPQAATQARRLPDVAQNIAPVTRQASDGKKQATRHFVIQPPDSFLSPGFLRAGSKNTASSRWITRRAPTKMPIAKSNPMNWPRRFMRSCPA